MQCVRQLSLISTVAPQCPSPAQTGSRQQGRQSAPPVDTQHSTAGQRQTTTDKRASHTRQPTFVRQHMQVAHGWAVVVTCCHMQQPIFSLPSNTRCCGLKSSKRQLSSLLSLSLSLPLFLPGAAPPSLPPPPVPFQTPCTLWTPPSGPRDPQQQCRGWPWCRRSQTPHTSAVCMCVCCMCVSDR